MPHSVLRYRVCIWDFDGTLFDSYPIMNQAMIQALEILGYRREPETGVGCSTPVLQSRRLPDNQPVISGKCSLEA